MLLAAKVSKQLCQRRCSRAESSKHMLQSTNFKTSFITNFAWSVLSKITLLKTCWQHFSQSKFLCADSWEQTLRETTNQSPFFKTRIARQLMQRRFVQTDFSILIPQTRLLKTEASKQFSQLRFHNLIHQAMIRRIRWYNQPPPKKKLNKTNHQIISWAMLQLHCILKTWITHAKKVDHEVALKRHWCCCSKEPWDM